MKRRTAQIAAASIAIMTAGCHSPVAADRFHIGVDARPGYTLTILSVTPAAGATIDWRQGPALARVRVEYERQADATSTRLAVCLARTTSTFIFSSCRDTPLLAMKGETDGHAGIYLVNGVPAWTETRYILAFLVEGDLLSYRRLYEDEIGIDRLSDVVFASRQVEHLLQWR